MDAKTKKRKKLLLICCIFAGIFALSFTAVTVIYNKYSLDIEKLTSLNNGIEVFSSNGDDDTLYNTNRSIIEISTLPDHVKNAFVDIEDKRFYQHHGYDLKRIAKAMLVNLSTRSKSQGASTISQQLIKNAMLSNEKTYSRKIQELVLSMKMEKRFSKDEILEMYLNTIYFGSNAYGIENASQAYFNKSAKDLTENEACCLAGIIKSPAKFSPRYNYENCIKRRNQVALAMKKKGDISHNTYKNILSSGIELAENNEIDNSYEEEAIFEACRLLNMTERQLINSGVKITTFKDKSLQESVKSTSSSVLGNQNVESLTIVLDNEGRVKAFYQNSTASLRNLRRQSGSALKPFAVYLPCITHDILTPSTLINDESINYSGFAPQNADKQFHGYVSTREAVAKSYNIPAVKALDYVGVKKAKQTLENFGIYINNSDMNLSLALGATKNGIKLENLVNAYSILANMGENFGVNFVDKITNKDGKILYQYSPYSETVANEDDCFLMNEILKETAISGTARRLNDLNMPICSKTGTASVEKGNTDLYNFAYTTENTLLTWIGNAGNSLLPSEMRSSNEPTEINKQILSTIYHNHQPKDFSQPENIEKLPYDVLERDDNHRIVAPTSSLERYISYDFFKASNPPPALGLDDNFNLNVSLNKSGALITFNTRKSKSYKLYKITSGKTAILTDINENSGIFEFKDTNIFSNDSIQYYLVDEQGNQSKIKTIFPKKFLVNELNNEVKANKKKWYV